MRRQPENVKPYNHLELLRNKYAVQDMLMNQVNFPLYYHDEDFTASDYSDRFDYEEFHSLIQKHFKEHPGSWEFSPPHRGAMKSFLSELYQKEITGYRIVRYTSGGGYPIFRFDVFAKSSNTPNEPTVTGNQEGRNRDLVDRLGEGLPARFYQDPRF